MTDEEIAAAEAKAASILASGISSTEVDGRKVTVLDPEKTIKAIRSSRKLGNAFGLVSRAIIEPPGTTGAEDCE